MGAGVFGVWVGVSVQVFMGGCAFVCGYMYGYVCVSLWLCECLCMCVCWWMCLYLWVCVCVGLLNLCGGWVWVHVGVCSLFVFVCLNVYVAGRVCGCGFVCVGVCWCGWVYVLESRWVCV